MTTNKCASTIAEGKHGDFAEQSHVNASPRSYFLCLCAHLFRNDVDSQHHSAEPYRSICTDIYACLSTSRSQVYWQSYTFGSNFFWSYPIYSVTAPDLTHMHARTHARTQSHTHTHMHTL